MKVLFILLFTHAHSECVSKSDCRHGNCINGKCECDKEWRGNTCNEPFCVFGKITGDNTCSCYYGHTLHDGYCDINCQHGNFSQSSGRCACNTGWKHASFSDTINWFKGICNQFKCQSDYHCQQLLPHVKEPSCPVKGWNCYCRNNIGYENNDAKCMGFMYWLSMTIWKGYKAIMLNIYPYLFGGFIIISIPFGTRRYRCDHYRSWWNRLKIKCGCLIHCQGDCPRKKRFYFRDDFALSLYWFKSALWWYTFSSTIMLVFAFIWSIALWMLVIILIIIISISICISALCGAGSDGGGNGAECCCCDQDCCGQGSYGQGCCYYGGYEDDNLTHHSYWYAYGPLPNQHRQSKSGYITTLFIYLINSYPVFPDNLQGGCVGYICGTHVLNGHNLYNRVGKLLSLNWCRNSRDLRDHNIWRSSITNYITNQYQSTNQSPSLKTIKRTSLVSQLIEHDPVIITSYNYIQLYSHEQPIIDKKLTVTNRQFIQDDECWICYHGPSYWHKWDCGHVFCQTCSFTMIDKDMPCPLCRKVTNSVHSYPIEYQSVRST
tara:strand:- start:268 stop:1908 length:1641 start_codon:yes stop_codon:yes gene_type:complete